MGSSRTRARTRVPCIGRQILNHCSTREVREVAFDQHLTRAKNPSCGLTRITVVVLTAVTSDSFSFLPTEKFFRLFLRSHAGAGSFDQVADPGFLILWWPVSQPSVPRPLLWRLPRAASCCSLAFTCLCLFFLKEYQFLKFMDHVE